MGLNRLVEDVEMERALDYLRDNARAIGEARAEMIRTERMVKHILAIEMKRYEGAISLREMNARASDAYLAAIYKEAVAAGKYEEMRALREAASTRIEAWRSEQASIRGMKI